MLSWFILLKLDLLPSGVLFRQPFTGSRHLHVRQAAPPPEVGSQQYAGTTHQRPSMEVRNLSSAFFFFLNCALVALILQIIYVRT